MKTTSQEITVQAQAQEAIDNSSAQVGVGIIVLASALIGTWSVACFVGALYQYGVVGMIKGWVTAVMGM